MTVRHAGDRCVVVSSVDQFTQEGGIGLFWLKFLISQAMPRPGTPALLGSMAEGTPMADSDRHHPAHAPQDDTEATVLANQRIPTDIPQGMRGMRDLRDGDRDFNYENVNREGVKRPLEVLPSTPSLAYGHEVCTSKEDERSAPSATVTQPGRERHSTLQREAPHREPPYIEADLVADQAEGAGHERTISAVGPESLHSIPRGWTRSGLAFGW